MKKKTESVPPPKLEKTESKPVAVAGPDIVVYNPEPIH